MSERETLLRQRDMAAYEVVGTATALLRFSDLSGEPFLSGNSFDKALLRDAVNRFEAADKALIEFDKANATKVTVKP